MTALSSSPAWSALKRHAAEARGISIAKSAESEKGRGARLTLSLMDAVFDFSCNLVNAETLSLLENLAVQQDVAGKFGAMMSGGKVNNTEGRAAWHTALRAENPPPEVAECLARMEEMATAISADATVTDVVHIGIGGSDLGPRLVCEALAGLHEGPRMHFVANVDPDDLDPVLMALDPAKTLVTVASKTFTTQETLLNLKGVRMWLKGRDDRVVAITANASAASAMGIAPERVLPLWDWVGGRFSIASAVGFPVAVAFGFDVFARFLEGMRAADEHVSKTPIASNIPVTMALLSVWYRSFLGCSAQAVVPYAARLASLPSYMQQLSMESNGKGVDRDGNAVDYATAPVVFGQVGTNAQHAFFQMLHQGPDVIPVDFIGARESHGCPARHKVLRANMEAQARALVLGRQGPPEKRCPGNRPSTSILLPRIDASYMGMLMALYEHKTVAEGFLWNLNSFDQFGVELGKDLAKELLAQG